MTQTTTTTNYYEIKHGNSVMVIDGKHYFDSYQDAVDVVKSFKLDPKKDNPSMIIENVVYWKRTILTIEHHIKTVIVMESF